ncbi:plasminogen [Drosophila grimshawi]|uniref:GH24381 n=1 Tax=Drosophila grimshawi TaxID=7222 RepID=B4JM81_DROGR|nr:plasminogen [Drosophila grimshawi]EDV91842.1 GH24381 [Drosophila grimshawi]
MQLNEHLKKVMKILIFAFLCTEMQTTFTHRELTKQHSIGTSNPTTGGKQHSRAPYQASIRLLEQEMDYFGKGHICSGALVGPSVVLTVAQCLHKSDSDSSYHPAELRVVLGSRQRFAPTTHAQVYGVTHVYLPPKQLSIAILMLDQDVPAHQAAIQPIALPVDAQVLDGDAAPLHISSWGQAGEDGHELHEMLTLRVKESSCQQPQQLCVLYDNQAMLAAYELDAGAPLTKSNQLLGLRSESTAFVDVASHVEWIQAQTGNGCNQNSSIYGILGLIVFTIYVLSCSRKSFIS